MFLIFSLLGLYCVDINIILILTDFALEVVAIDADPLSIIIGLEWQELHFYEYIFLLAELIVNLE
jgi:hypothetical protein